MCHAVRCKMCSKTTWAGCGNHIELALAGVPKSERCRGHSAAEIAQYRSENSVFKRLFGR
ncbi:MAG: hypothetical protein BGO26_14310 [Actinobacteria bacterium 69-20]|jgi:hypothetical protein|nr:MAG: hypothetical protein BGO26_14310 [Actinobacteria bacterium 69-20]